MKCILALLCALTGGPALAAGYWSVDVIDMGGYDTCVLGSHTDTTFVAIWAKSDRAGGGVAVMFQNDAWNMAESNVRARVDLDYEKYYGTAWINQDTAVVDVGDQFLADFAEKSAMALYNNSGRRLMFYSLHGSRSGLIQLSACLQSLNSF